MIACDIQTNDGIFHAEFSDRGLCSLSFPGTNGVRKSNQPPLSTQQKEWVRITETALADSLRGCTPKRLPPIDLSAGTEFQKTIWSLLSAIPRGKTLTYSEVATKAGRPNCARAVGQACGANPVPVLVPCHRVLAANKRIGGFSGGLDWKKRLLEREGIGELA